MQNICCGMGDLEEIRRRYAAEDPGFVRFCEMTVAYFGERLSRLEREGRWEQDAGQWTFERLSFRGRELELSEPLTVRIHRQGNQWRAENRELGICVFASSIGRLLERVAEAFFSLWDKYAITDYALPAEEAAIRQAVRRIMGNRSVGPISENKQKTF